MTSTPHLAAFCPSHTTRPFRAQRGGHGIHDFAGIPQMTAPDDVPRPLFDAEFDQSRADEMEAIKEAIKQKMAATFGGTWTKDLR